MASTSSTGVEIQKFDVKKLFPMEEYDAGFTDPVAIAKDEWHSLDEIARSSIRMHMTDKVYFSMVKETTTFALREKLQAFYE